MIDSGKGNGFEPAFSILHPIRGASVQQGLAVLTAMAHEVSRERGRWTDEAGNPIDIHARGVFGEKVALIHSEISEALEGYRKGAMDDKLPHRLAVEVEFADAILRICDLAGALGLDLGGAVVEKALYNRTRPDHSPEARAAAGGKRF